MDTTRERIITSTNELFRRQGFNATSMKQIGDVAGATTGSLYHFFPGGKKQLSAEVIRTSGSAYRDLFDLIADAADDPATMVIDMFEGAAVVLEETDFIDPCPIGTVAREVASMNDELRQASSEVFESWIVAATSRFVAAGMDPADARDLASLFVATIEGCFVLARASRDATILRSSARRLAELVSRQLESVSESAALGEVP